MLGKWRRTKVSNLMEQKKVKESIRPCYSRGWTESPSKLTFEQRTGGSETSDSPDLLRWSPLHGLFGWPGRVESQVRLLNNKEDWLPWSFGPMTLDF